jgi:predicted RNase H-like HicB family nuclease
VRPMRLNVHLIREPDGCWRAVVVEWPELVARGTDRLEAFRRVEAKALRTFASWLEEGRPIPGAPAELALAFSVL